MDRGEELGRPSGFFRCVSAAVDIEVPQLANPHPIGSIYGIYANIWGILMVNVTIYGTHGSYGVYKHGVFRTDFSIAL